MTRIKTAGITAGFALALVVGILAGGVLSTANAEGPFRDAPNADLARPTLADGTDGAGGMPDWVKNLIAEREADAGTEALVAEPEVVQCSIVDGCTVELVDADGEVVKTMHITFTDAGEAEVSE
ncbi:MAG: hypothetical protein M0R73_00515 [Dehalococcoidia bacterium]|nr:hypothetical protein [Dehalococcoidia bacterium]